MPSGAVLCRAECFAVLAIFVHATYHSKYHIIPGTGTTVNTPPALLVLLQDIAESQSMNSRLSAAQLYEAQQCSAAPCFLPCGAVLCRVALCFLSNIQQYQVSCEKYQVRYQVPRCSAYSYKYLGKFSCAQIDLRKARERGLATLDEKSTSSGIAEPYAR